MRIGTTLALAAAVLCAGAAAPDARAETFTVDPARSELSVTGTLTGNFASQQTDDSLTTSYSGTITADLTAGRISFPGGSLLDAALQSSNQQPREDATPGSRPADYGRTAPGPFGSTALEALRSFVLDVEDDTSGFGIAVAPDGSFASNSLVMEIAQGSSDVLHGNTPVETNLTGKGTANGISAPASTLVTSDGMQTLTLHFNTGPISYLIAGTNDTSIAFTGMIVATRPVPEPAAASILLTAAALTTLRRRRRRTHGASA